MNQDKCVKCKKGSYRYHDYGFMISGTCDVCGYRHDTPKPDRMQEYNEYIEARNDSMLKRLEGDG